MSENGGAIRGRVLHYIDTTGPGGGETVFLDVASGMRELGWHPHAVVVGPGWVLDNVRLRSLPVDVVTTGHRLDVGYALRLRQIVRRERIDLIHAHFFSPSVYAAAVSLTTGVPVVATFHGAPDIVSGGLMTRARYRLIARRAAIACVSDSIRRDLLQSTGIPANAVTVVCNGIDAGSFTARDRDAARKALRVSQGSVVVGALGNIRPAKDYETLLRAAALLAVDDRFRFMIAGDTEHPLFADLVALRDRLGLQDRVEFLGFRNDAADVLAAFDVLAISSQNEGFSLAAVQGMSAGTPVVATRSGGPEEIITDGMDGLLVPIRAPEELARAIRRVVDEPKLRESIVSSARKTVEGRFSKAAMLSGYDALYSRLCSS